MTKYLQSLNAENYQFLDWIIDSQDHSSSTYRNGASWAEGPYEKFQFHVLPMKNLFFVSEILLDNCLTFKMKILELRVALAKKFVHLSE